MKFLRKYFESRESRLWGDRIFEYFGIALATSIVCFFIFSLLPDKSASIYIIGPLALSVVLWEIYRKQNISNFDELPIDHDLYKEVSWELAGNNLRIFVSNNKAIRIPPTSSNRGDVFLYRGLLDELDKNELGNIIELVLIDGYAHRKHIAIQVLSVLVAAALPFGVLFVKNSSNPWMFYVIMPIVAIAVVFLLIYRQRKLDEEFINWFSPKDKALHTVNALNKVDSLVNRSHPQRVVSKSWNANHKRDMLTKAARAQKLPPLISDVKSLENSDDDEIHVE